MQCSPIETPLPAVLCHPERLQLPDCASRSLAQISSLNDMAIHSALASDIDQAVQFFGLALNQLGETQCIHLSLPNGLSPAVALEHRLEYDEGWNAFSSFVFLDQFRLEDSGFPASKQELAVALLYNLGQALLIRRLDDALVVFRRAYQLTQASPIKASHSLAVPLLHKIGCIQYWNHEITAAIETFQQALEFCRADGDKLPAAATLNCLGVLHFHLAEPDTGKALELLVRALAIQQSSGSGSEQRAVATTLNNIGRVHFLAGRLDLALTAYEEALRIRQQVLGGTHPDVAATLYNLGQTLHQKSNLSAALQRYEEFVRIAGGYQRPNRYLVVVLKCMALIYQEQGDFTRAQQFLEHALAVGRATLGVHADVASILNKLGNLFYEMGNADGAIQMYRQGLAVERVVLEKNHPNITVSLSNIGQICKQRGDYASALRLYKDVLTIQLESCNGADPAVAVTLSNIGLIHYHLKNYTAALDMYQRALSVRRDCFGEDSLDVASCLNSIGLVLFKLSLPELALESFTESLRIRRLVQGECHHDIAIILYNIATIYLELGNEDDAIRCYEGTLAIERKALGPLHDDVIATLQYLAKVYQHRGDINLALEHYEEVLRVQRLRLKGDDMVVARSLNVIANLRLQRCDVAGAMEAMCEAFRIAMQGPECEEEIRLAGVDFYGFARLHPEAAAAA